MLEEVVIVFCVLCHINCMEILTTIIYLFHIKSWNFLYKNPRASYSIFLIATNIAKHFPRLIQEQLNTPHPPLSLSSERETTYYPTPIKASFQLLSICPLQQTVKFVCSSLNVTNPKNPKAFILHPQANLSKSTDF